MTVTPSPNQDKGTIARAARKWAQSGCSVIPIRADGTKRPAIEWKKYQTFRAEQGELVRWFDETDLGTQRLGIGIVCGAVSGNLEMLELEARACDAESLQKVRRACESWDVAGLWDHFQDYGLTVLSPSGGMHLIYRVKGEPIPGNTKVARRPATAEELAENPQDKVKVLAETRGEGGYFVAAPSGGSVHPSGQDWKLVAGEIGNIPTIDPTERDRLHAAIRDALDQMPVVEIPARPSAPVLPSGTRRPGDDYNETADWRDILEPHGWQIHHIQSGTTYWTRPGKNRRDGHSATTGREGNGVLDRLYVMSSATELPTEQPLSKFWVYAHYEHRGDVAAAARSLGRQGMGEQRAPKVTDQDWMDWVPEVEGSNVDSPTPKPEPRRRRRAERRESYTDMGTANRFLRENPDSYLYAVGTKGPGKWLTYNGYYWEADETGTEVAESLEDLIDRMSDEAERMAKSEEEEEQGRAKALRAYVKSARSNSGRKGLLATVAAKLSIATKDLNPHDHMLGLANGVLNTQTGQVLNPDPRYLITRVLGVAYDPTASAPRTEKYMADVLPNPAYREYVQRGIGYTMTGEQNQRAFFILHGEPGTGKSQFLELFNHMFGDYSTPAADGAFRKNTGSAKGPSAELHSLRNARFVFASESDEDVVFDADVVKRICGGDTMSTRTLYEDSMSHWRAKCVVWLVTNHFPRFPADEEAVWDRVKAIPFDTKFPKTGGRIVSIADELFAAEASGILNLMIAWLKEYRQHGLGEPDILVSGVAAKQDEVNPVKQFWDEMVGSEEIVANETGQIAFTLLYQNYANWYQQSWGLRPMGSRRFGRLLKKVVGYEDLKRSNGKTFLIGWDKRGANGILGSMT